MSLSGFNRRRRAILAAQEAEKANVSEEENDGQNSQNEDENVDDNVENQNNDVNNEENQNNQDDEQTDDEQNGIDVDAMDIEEVKAMLEEKGIAFPHNTGEKKLREKLKNAIK